MRIAPATPGLWLLLATAALALGCLRSESETVIRLGHGLPTTHPVHKALEHMAGRALEISEGRLRVVVYPAEQLGSERECLELLQIGSLGMTKVSAAVMENFAPGYRVLSVPYVFRDEGHRWAVLEGEVGKEILQEGVPKRLLGLAFYDAGQRSFYTRDRAVQVPGDLEGLKIRTQESPTAMSLVRSLGGAATPLAWGELYTALQQGVVDGAENNPPSFHLSRHYEVARYYSLDEHTAVPDVLLIGTAQWERLSRDERGWLRAAVAESAVVQRDLWRTATETALRAVQEAGVEVVRPAKEPFAARARELRAEFERDPHMARLLRAIAGTRS
jgi:tripartite ATP-independent transporter DctP family solute receptor